MQSNVSMLFLSTAKIATCFSCVCIMRLSSESRESIGGANAFNPDERADHRRRRRTYILFDRPVCARRTIGQSSQDSRGSDLSCRHPATIVASDWGKFLGERSPTNSCSPEWGACLPSSARAPHSAARPSQVGLDYLQGRWRGKGRNGPRTRKEPRNVRG
jgi:hypothetical protein